MNVVEAGESAMGGRLSVDGVVEVGVAVEGRLAAVGVVGAGVSVVAVCLCLRHFPKRRQIALGVVVVVVAMDRVLVVSVRTLCCWGDPGVRGGEGLMVLVSVGAGVYSKLGGVHSAGVDILGGGVMVGVVVLQGEACAMRALAAVGVEGMVVGLASVCSASLVAQYARFSLFVRYFGRMRPRRFRLFFLSRFRL